MNILLSLNSYISYISYKFISYIFQKFCVIHHHDIIKISRYEFHFSSTKFSREYFNYIPELIRVKTNLGSVWELTFPSRLSCTISWSEFPIPMKAQVVESCSVPPSASMASFFLFQPLPKRYIQGGGQKNLCDSTLTLTQGIINSTCTVSMGSTNCNV